MTTAIDHPTLAHVKNAFPSTALTATSFRGQTSLIVPEANAHDVLTFLRNDPNCDYAFLSDVTAVDYLDYPIEQPGRFAVVWVLRSYTHSLLLVVKTYVSPTLDTTGNEIDPALSIASVCDVWAGAEWMEREVFDMFGITFRDHPDLRRILLWKDFPAFPLRKDYPLRGRGERNNLAVLDRDSR